MPVHAPDIGERPTETLVFHDGTSVQVRPFNFGNRREWAYLAQAPETPENYDRMAALLADILPGQTPAFINALSDERMALIISQAQGRLTAALEALEKNGGAAPAAQPAAASPPPRSSPTTSTSTSLPASGASQAARGTTGTTSPRRGRSSTQPTV